MKTIDLNGIWSMSGNNFKCDGKIPGSVYSILLDSGLMEDPFYRTNETAALELAKHDYSFSREFDYSKADENKRVLLRCEGGHTCGYIYKRNAYCVGKEYASYI